MPLPNILVRFIAFVVMNIEESATPKEPTARPAPRHLAQGAHLVCVRAAGWQVDEISVLPNGVHILVIAVAHVMSHVAFACRLKR
jgi:hypothetical protein